MKAHMLQFGLRPRPRASSLASARASFLVALSLVLSGALSSAVVVSALAVGVSWPTNAYAEQTTSRERAAANSGRNGFRPQVGDERLILRTIAGDIVIALYPEIAPKNIEQVVRLARMGAYDGTHFSRLDPRFVAQLSTVNDRLRPLSAEQSRAVKKLPLEVDDRLIHRRGSVSMARDDGDPNSAASSFSILLSTAPHLDSKYTIIGHVQRGMDVIDKMLAVPAKKPGFRPVTRVTVKTIDVVKMSEATSLKLAPPSDIAVSDSEKSKVANQSVITPPHIVYGLVFMLLIGVAQVFLASRLDPKHILAISMINTFICAFLILMALTPVAIFDAQNPESNRLIAIGIFFGLLAILKLMGRFESPN